MTSLLHIDSSARGASFSRKVAAAFVAEWRAVHPAGGYAYRDLGAHPVPPADEARTQIAVQASAAGIQELAHMTQAVRRPAQERSWAVARPLIEELLAADAVLIASPMYNLSIPSTLKAWIDQISFPWLPLAGRTAVVVTARGGSYAPGTPREGYDHQEPYLRAYFQTLGLTDLHFIHTELTNAPRSVPCTVPASPRDLPGERAGRRRPAGQDHRPAGQAAHMTSSRTSPDGHVRKDQNKGGRKAWIQG